MGTPKFIGQGPSFEVTSILEREKSVYASTYLKFDAPEESNE